MNKSPLRSLLSLVLASVWVLAVAPLTAQSGTPAQAAALALECQGCQPVKAPVSVRPGRRLHIHGPAGTRTISGKLVHGGDTIAVKSGPDIRRMPAQDITLVGVNRWLFWLELIGFHLTYLPAAGLLLILAFVFGNSVVIWASVLLAIYLGALIYILANKTHRYRIGPWQIRRP